MRIVTQPFLVTRPVGSGSKTGITYVLRDEFTTDQTFADGAARTCEPGPGTLTIEEDVTVTGANIQIAGSVITMARPSAGQSWAGYGFFTPTGLARVNGRAVYGAISCSIIDRTQLGWRIAATLGEMEDGFQLDGGSNLSGKVNAGDVVFAGSLSASTVYHLIVVCRSSGYFYFIRGGSQYPSYSLIYVSAVSVDTPLYPALSNFNSAVASFDTLTVYDLGGAFLTDFGTATAYDATPVANDTATGTADALMEFTWTPVAAETLKLFFRRISDDETYRLDCDQVGGTIKLYSRTGAVDTELDAGKTQTWTAGTQYRIVIRYAAGVIRTFVETNTTVTLKHSVTGQTLNLSTTGCKCSGFASGANWAIFPYTWAGSGDVTTLASA